MGTESVLLMKKGGLFKTIRVLAVVGTALAIAILLVVLRPEAERQAPVEAGRLVEVFPVRAAAVNLFIEAYGTVRPRESLKLVAEVRGQVVDLAPSFEEGAYVKKGQTLIRIDPRDYQLEVQRRQVQIRQANAEIKRMEQEVRNLKGRIKIAQTDVRLAKNDFSRLQHLVRKKVIAQSTLDKAEQKYLASLERLRTLENQMALTGPQKEQLMAQRDMAAVMLREARLNLERTRIAAPFDGWVLEKAVEKGQHVLTGQYLGRIYRAGALEIEVRIATRDLKWLPGAMRVRVPLAAEVVYASGGLRHVWPGRVVRTKAQMDEKTRTLPMIVDVDERQPADSQQPAVHLRPGMFVTVKIRGRSVARAFVLPRYVVYPGDVVYTAAHGRLKIIPVHVLRRYKDTVIVDKGLYDDDLIIKTPLASATDGMPVRVQTGSG